jgi:RNA polymerase sigma-70 factor (ECF subfamily)
MTRGSPDDLLDGLVAGEERAFAALYDRHAAGLFRAAVRVLGSREEAEDAVQDVFVALVRAGDRLRAVRNLRAYLFASVRRAAMRRLRGCRATATLPDDAPAASSAVGDEDAEASARLAGAVAALPPEQRGIIALHVDGGLTFAECGEAMGVSPNTAASRYRYALEALRRTLKE